MESQNSKWQHQPQWNGKFSWVNTAFLVASPLLFLGLLPVYIYSAGFAWADLAIFSFMIAASGFSITAGYHRLFAHQSYESSPFVRLFYLIFGAAALQNSAFKWCSDHRYHHRFVDKESDPYNINRGFFYAHMGWIFYNDPEERSFANINDLAADPLVRWQHKYFLWIAVASGFVLPTLFGLCFGRPFAGFFAGGLLRLLVVHHGTFLINSSAHTFGTRPYSTKVSARDCWWLAFFTNGEGYHNFHHAFANDYRNGTRWFHWDPTKWLIWTLNQFGLTRELRRTPDAHILKARLESSYEQARSGVSHDFPAQLEAMKEMLESKVQEFQLRLREFHAWKENFVQENARSRKKRAAYWRRRLRAERNALEFSVKEFRLLLSEWQRTGQLTLA